MTEGEKKPKDALHDAQAQAAQPENEERPEQAPGAGPMQAGGNEKTDQPSPKVE